MSRLEVAKKLVTALRSGSAADFASLSEVLAEDLALSTFLGGTIEGKQAALTQLQSAQSSGAYARIETWGEPAENDGTVEVKAEMPLVSFTGGYLWELHFDEADSIAKIVQSNVRQIRPLPPGPIELTENFVEVLRGAFESGLATMVSYVDDSGQPHVTPRGTTQVLSKDELAIWVRNREGGIATAIKHNPRIAVSYFAYRGSPYSGSLEFQGRAHVDEDGETRTRVFEGSPPVEQRLDPERKGFALVVELDRVNGFVSGNRVNMVR